MKVCDHTNKKGLNGSANHKQHAMLWILTQLYQTMYNVFN